MPTDDNIRDEKLQYDIKKEITNISALWSGKIDQYDYLKGVKILPFDKIKEWRNKLSFHILL